MPCSVSLRRAPLLFDPTVHFCYRRESDVAGRRISAPLTDKDNAVHNAFASHCGCGGVPLAASGKAAARRSLHKCYKVDVMHDCCYSVPRTCSLGGAPPVASGRAAARRPLHQCYKVDELQLGAVHALRHRLLQCVGQRLAKDAALRPPAALAKL
eukprot:885167-Prorocentrum_minimum.AAC.2